MSRVRRSTRHNRVTCQRVAVIVAVPVRPSLSAEMRTEPAVIAVTSPVDDTLKTVGDSLLHVTTRPSKGDPFVSRVDAVRRSVSPTRTSDVIGDTTTVLTWLELGAIGAIPPPTGPSAPQAEMPVTARATTAERTRDDMEHWRRSGRQTSMTPDEGSGAPSGSHLSRCAFT